MKRKPGAKRLYPSRVYRCMDPTWGWFEWVWFLAAWTVPALIVARWLIPRLKMRQWWALLAAPFLYLLLFVPMTMMCCKPYFGARAVGLSSRCQTQLKELSAATMMFNQMNGERMPHASSWQADLTPYMRANGGSDPFHCPASKSGHYVYNAALSGVDLSRADVPRETVLFFESDSALDFGGQEAVTSHPPHGGSIWVVTVDGSTRRYRPGSSKDLIWKLSPIPAASRPISKALGESRRLSKSLRFARRYR